MALQLVPPLLLMHQDVDKTCHKHLPLERELPQLPCLPLHRWPPETESKPSIIPSNTLTDVKVDKQMGSVVNRDMGATVAWREGRARGRSHGVLRILRLSKCILWGHTWFLDEPSPGS